MATGYYTSGGTSSFNDLERAKRAATGTDDSGEYWQTASGDKLYDLRHTGSQYVGKDIEGKELNFTTDPFKTSSPFGALGSLGMLGGFGGFGGAGGAGGTGGTGSSGGGLPSGQLTGDEKDARAAAFAGAREQAGQTSAAALRSLQDLYAGQGLSGSTMEAASAGKAIGAGQAGVTQFTRDQMMQDLKRAQDQAVMQYQGGITQRGQDMGFLQALLSLLSGGGTSTSTSSYSGQLY